MNIGYIFVAVIAGMAYMVSGIPTPDEMQADFDAAQKFYASGAYDQALEEYQDVTEVESRFLNEDQVVVEFGDMQVPVKDASYYKIGSTYWKMVQEENRQAGMAEEDAEIERHQKLALEYAQQSSDYFQQTQEITQNVELRAQAQNALVTTWYEVNDYDRVIEEGNELIEKYPDSQYVLDAMYNIGWAYYDKEQYDRAIDAFTQLVTRFPNAGYKSERALFQVGEAYFDQQEYEQASEYYQQLVDKMRINELTDQEIQRIQRDKLAGITNETSIDLAAKAQLKVGACYANVGDYESAEVSYKRIADLFQFDKNLIAEAYQRLANMHLERGDFESSIQAYRDAIDEVPDKIFSARMQVLIAQGYFDAERYEDAIREFNNYIVNYSDVARRANFDVDEAIFNLGRSHYELADQMLGRGEEELARQNLETALATYDRLFEQFPDTDLTERVWFYQGLAQMKFEDEEHLNNALDKFNAFLEQYPESPYLQYVYFFIARAHQQLENYEQAIEWYNNVLERFPETEQKNSAWMEIAVAYKNMDQEEQSYEYYLRVEPTDPSLFTTARLLAAQYQMNQRNYEEVIEVIDGAVDNSDAIDSDYRLSQMYLMRANAQKSLNNIEEAIEDYTNAYDLGVPETQEQAAVFRAGAYIEQGQLARAETDLKELVDSENEEVSEMAKIRLAVISVKQDKSEQAIQTYLDLYNSTQDQQEKIDYLRNLIQLTSMSEDWDRLNEFANMMLESDFATDKQIPNSEIYYKEEALFQMALAAESQDDYYTAFDYLSQCYERFPNSYYSSDVLLKMGVYYLSPDALATEPDAIDIAAEYFNEYVNKFPNGPQAEIAQYYLGLCYYNGRRFTEAAETFSSFASKYPNSEFTPEAVYYDADSNYNLGNLEESIQLFDRVISNYPNHDRAREALYTKAWALMDLERQEQAIEAMQQLVDRYPDSEFAPSSMFSVADYYYNAQQYREAMDYYQAVLDNYPDSDVAEKVPETIDELRETIAYIEYEKAFNVFSRARETNDPNLYREAAEMFEQIASEFPYTESEIGALSNMGMCYEATEQWQNAVEAYDKVIQRFEEGADVSPDAYTFANMHKNYITANKM